MPSSGSNSPGGNGTPIRPRTGSGAELLAPPLGFSLFALSMSMAFWTCRRCSSRILESLSIHSDMAIFHRPDKLRHLLPGLLDEVRKVLVLLVRQLLVINPFGERRCLVRFHCHP